MVRVAKNFQMEISMLAPMFWVNLREKANIFGSMETLTQGYLKRVPDQDSEC